MKFLVATTLVLLSALLGAQGAPFTFAGFQFDQDATPSLYRPLEFGRTSGSNPVVITTLPDNVTTTQVTGFPDSVTGFKGELSLGALATKAAATNFPKALTLIKDGKGDENRAGFELSWTKSQTLKNVPGPDIVIFVTGVNGQPKAGMVQVRIYGTNQWTRWLYLQPTSFASYASNLPGLPGGFATAYDLSDFGVGSNQAIDRIRYVNMRHVDTMVDAGSRQGIVFQEDDGKLGYAQPYPGPFATFPEGYVAYGATTRDPQPLYVGVMNKNALTVAKALFGYADDEDWDDDQDDLGTKKGSPVGLRKSMWRGGRRHKD